MRFIVGLISLIASVLVITLAGTWLTNRFDVGPSFGIWDEKPFEIYAEHWRTGDGVNATKMGDVSIEISPFQFRGREWEIGQDEILVLPVTAHRGTKVLNRSLSLGGGHSFSEGGGCRSSVVNLLIVGEDLAAEKPLFSHRVFIASYIYIRKDDLPFVIAMVVSEDTNKDGYLDCGDRATLERISLSDRTKIVSDHTFIPDQLSKIAYDHYHSGDLLFLKFVREAGRFVFTSYKVSPTDLTVSVVEGPDLLPEAQAAFEKIHTQ